MKDTKLWGFTSQSSKKAISITIAILLFTGIYAFAISVEAGLAPVQAQGQPNSTSPSPMNATQANATSANVTKPVDGYGGPPTGPLTAVRHVFDDPTLRVYHFCKPNDKIMMVCQAI